ncbi:transposase, partial [Bacteroides pyogenes]
TGKAIEYTFSLLPRLSRYVNDGRVNIDNNLIENAIRPLALGSGENGACPPTQDGSIHPFLMREAA